MTVTEPIAAFKQNARETWALGHYHDIGTLSAPASAHLVTLTGPQPGESVLDVACGTGTTAIVARATGASVTGLDITPALLAQARDHAKVAGFDDIEWREGDAEELPFPDGSFDVVLSTFGHMFAPRPAAAAEELVRVTKPGGRIVFTTWPPESFPGLHLGLTAQFMTPPPGVASPLEWGMPDNVRRFLGDEVEDVHSELASERFVLPAPSPEHVWALFSKRFGPTIRAVEALRDDDARLAAYKREWIAVARRWYRDGRVVFQYLATRALKRP